ncbi:unnamed protein product, partial [Amoebophrya sp. A25]
RGQAAALGKLENAADPSAPQQRPGTSTALVETNKEQIENSSQEGDPGTVTVRELLAKRGYHLGKRRRWRKRRSKRRKSKGKGKHENDISADNGPIEFNHGADQHSNEGSSPDQSPVLNSAVSKDDGPIVVKRHRNDNEQQIRDEENIEKTDRDKERVTGKEHLHSHLKENADSVVFENMPKMNSNSQSSQKIKVDISVGKEPFGVASTIDKHQEDAKPNAKKMQMVTSNKASKTASNT